MASTLSTLRIVAHVLVAILLTASICFAAAAMLTTGWQTFTDTSTGDVHQHGLWFDYTFAKPHLAGKTEHEWEWSYKFGQAVEGDEDHRWRPYQYNTLILLAVGGLIAFATLLFSYLAPYFCALAVIFMITAFFPAIITAWGLILFFTTASLPEYDHVNIRGGRRINLDISYSFYLGVVAAAGYALAFLLSIAAGVVDISLQRRGERPSLRDNYIRVSTRATDRPPHYNTSV